MRIAVVLLTVVAFADPARGQSPSPLSVSLGGALQLDGTEHEHHRGLWAEAGGPLATRLRWFAGGMLNSARQPLLLKVCKTLPGCSEAPHTPLLSFAVFAGLDLLTEGEVTLLDHPFAFDVRIGLGSGFATRRLELRTFDESSPRAGEGSFGALSPTPTGIARLALTIRGARFGFVVELRDTVHSVGYDRIGGCTREQLNEFRSGGGGTCDVESPDADGAIAADLLKDEKTGIGHLVQLMAGAVVTF